MGVLFCLDRRTEGVQGARKATCLCRCTPTLPEGNPLRGIDAPTTARTVGLPPRRGKYFLSKRKKVPKKARGTATTEAARPAVRRGLRSAGALRAVLDLGSLRSPAGKKASTAHFDGGARNVARNLVGQITPTLVRAPVLAFFRRQNGRAFFPSLPNAALLPRSWRLVYSKRCGLEVVL